MLEALKIDLLNLINKGGGTLLLNHDLSLYSTMRLEANADIILIENEETLIKIIKCFKLHKRGYQVLGLGANMLLPMKSSITFLKLKFSFDKNYISEAKDEYDLPASISLSILSSHAIKFGLIGWEVFTGIPASLGGAVYMNAGTNLGEIGPLVKEVSIIEPDGNKKIIVTDKHSFSYRKNHFCNKGDIITGVKLRTSGRSPLISQKIKDYLKLRNDSQPLKAFTCGCVFKNDKKCGAGKLIDSLGLKGLQIGDIKVSQIHANFMENLGNGNRDDVLKMISIIKKEVELNFGIKLETEVILLTPKFDQ